MAALVYLAALVAAQAGITVHVATVPTRTSSPHCLFLIQNRLVEGGRQTTCLRAIRGVPYAKSVVTSRGTMSFRLARGTITASVTSVLRFGSDGIHASQRVTGIITGGTRAYRGARGSLSGRGTVVDRAAALGRVQVAYRIVLSSTKG
jgi:hypothetical protein